MKHTLLQLENQLVRPDNRADRSFSLNWTWEAGEQWVILGDNGSGKTRFLQLLESQAGPRAHCVSFEGLDHILQQQLKQDESNINGGFDAGTPLFRFLGLESPDDGAAELPLGGLSQLLEQGIRFLSTGEMRRALICRAVLARPSLLMLDEPFDGLDVQARADMRALIRQLMQQGQPTLMILNRQSEILPEHTHVGVFRDQRMIFSASRHQWEQQRETLTAAIDHGKPVPGPLPGTVYPPADQPLVEMHDVTVRYGEKTVLDRLSWQVNAGEHWQISGPNGAGKSTLLNLVSGDNPQAYRNDIRMFGRRRGTGETVWDIKQKVGIVSPQLQLSYRVAVSARMCILSGLFDSIGIYRNVDPMHRLLADRWLDYLGMSDRATQPFNRFSYGEQRLLLIARGLIKHPPLLILDEPCQGLDDANRLRVLDLLGEFANGTQSTLLYVTHLREDRIKGINRQLEFVPMGEGYTVRQHA